MEGKNRENPNEKRREKDEESKGINDKRRNGKKERKVAPVEEMK